MVDVSIVIACYNEEALLEDSVNEILRIMNSTRWKYELIFVDDYSQDRTREIIDSYINTNKKNNIKCIFHEKNKGRGKTVTDGMLAAEGTFIGFLDIDLEVGAYYIPLMIITLEKGADVATALRIYKETANLFFRSILSIGYRFLVRQIIKIPIKDTETGYKFFRRDKLLPILKQTNDPGWFWDTEIMALSYFSGLKIVENPCLFIRRNDKKSSVRILHDSLDYLKKLLAFRKKIAH